MIAVDTNLLVYAHREDSPWCGEARRCLTELAESASPWAIPWPCVHEFLSISTHPRIYQPPSRTDQALAELEGLFAAPTLRLLAENEATWAVDARLLRASRAAGPKVHDARIVAICLSHAVEELWSADRDFSRFKGLKVRNPLAG